MTYSTRPSIALLAFGPENLKPEALLSFLTAMETLGLALARLGWHVDLFTGQPQALPLGHSLNSCSPTRIASHAQIVHLPTKLTPDELAAQIQSFQTKSGLITPLFHSFDGRSAQVGRTFKEQHNWRWIHSPWDYSSLKEQQDSSPDQMLLWRSPNTITPQFKTDEVSQMRYQRHWQAFSHHAQDIAARLHLLYRQHLAIYVGADWLTLPPVYDLTEQAGDRQSA